MNIDELNSIQNEQIKKLYDIFILVDNTLTFHQEQNNISQKKIDEVRKKINQSIDWNIDYMKKTTMEKIVSELYK